MKNSRIVQLCSLVQFCPVAEISPLYPVVGWNVVRSKGSQLERGSQELVGRNEKFPHFSASAILHRCGNFAIVVESRLEIAGKSSQFSTAAKNFPTQLDVSGVRQNTRKLEVKGVRWNTRKLEVKGVRWNTRKLKVKGVGHNEKFLHSATLQPSAILPRC